METTVKIIEMKPQRVLSFYAFSDQPEGDSLQKLVAWVKENFSDAEIANHRYFGFNNPSPTPASSKYGYEQWVTVADDQEIGAGAEVKELPGGLYAVYHQELPSPEHIGKSWQTLSAWINDSAYRYDESRQWLEEVLNPDALIAMRGDQFMFAIYSPVVKR
ncbi:MAG: GyrI-like domain-containing protein [Anaerolineaceae bacterium]|nr:GyrI-like domain-containing protein [Anaerolineaceae bacterium]